MTMMARSTPESETRRWVIIAPSMAGLVRGSYNIHLIVNPANPLLTCETARYYDKAGMLKRSCLWTAVLLTGGAIMTLASETQADFGRMPDGSSARIYTLTNKNGVEARITNYGGILISLKAPDRHGEMADVVLGFDSLAGYLANPGPFFGALVGRYANRIGHARLSLDGMEYHLEKNDG